MLIKTDVYQYAQLMRTDAPEGRYYQTEENGRKLPSVTTILSKTKPADSTKKLDDWKKRVGETEADEIVKESVYIGEHLHKNLENHLLGIQEQTGPLISKIMTSVVVKHGIKNIDEVWGIEAPLYYPDLYAGTSDLIGVFKGIPCIMDFKNSRKTKKKEWIEDYTLQLAAYAMAHNKIHNTNIKDGVIMMVTRDLKYQEFEIFGSEFQTAMDKWNNRVEQFYKDYN